MGLILIISLVLSLFSGARKREFVLWKLLDRVIPCYGVGTGFKKKEGGYKILELLDKAMETETGSQTAKCGTTLLTRKWSKFKENFVIIVNI
jgi:hypothetical protein